ncbi:MAG: anhydro-N-acetylmuramic acid kinase [Gammaproteobacteria bacterium]|nr:anhydro-N-acetylmuramic acid kinase [Gammaproteobacteria bacterium]
MGWYVGLISGTSMDAIDAVVVDFDASPLRILAAAATEYPRELAQRLATMLDDADAVSLDAVGQLDVDVGRAFAQAANALLAQSGIDSGTIAAIGSHGQTLRHRIAPPTPFSWQIGDPNVIAEATGITVVADFRRRDVAAGGQGAPLVPLFHDGAFRSDREDRVIVNVGGIANLTVLRRDTPLRGFDTGPGNRLMDAWMQRWRHEPFDRDGAFAASGRCDAALLTELLAEPYLARPAPKSTGRELFNLPWLDARLDAHRSKAPAVDPADVQATLREYTAETIARAVAEVAPGAALYVCGGGAHNPGLLDALRRRTAPSRVATTAALGLDPDFVEATAFAFFARRTLAGLPSSAASVTGARGPRVLGGIYPATRRERA